MYLSLIFFFFSRIINLFLLVFERHVTKIDPLSNVRDTFHVFIYYLSRRPAQKLQRHDNFLHATRSRVMESTQ